MTDHSNEITELTALLNRQLHAPIQMLLLAIDACPDDLWTRSCKHPPIWQHVLHATYYLQKWMRPIQGSLPPPAFADMRMIDLEAPAEPAVKKDILRTYLLDVASICHSLLVDGGMSAEALANKAITQSRHAMYHVGCISTLLAVYGSNPLEWIGSDDVCTQMTGLI